ncbi:hypothetical protein FNB15_03185 [Ferrovibrio terrae]|uniref:Sulfotransferase domain-containing protein n=1 Tax=Ferrovibrio terrae TaxID=2594003 RepID=A0A516GXW9_9PROT|nr:hypothetical protein [Ferrovibrio terrae]QDO96342.1 hypothetical protein FNB15_03185 [Ferrovibrio terrae]
MTGARLEFFDTDDDLTAKAAAQWPAGCEILLDGSDAEKAITLAGLLQARHYTVAVTPALAAHGAGSIGKARSPHASDHVIVVAASGTAVTHALWAYRELSDLKVFAPRSDHFWDRRFFFVICPPKTGGHMLMNFLGRIGFKPHLPISGMLSDGRIYYANGIDQHAEFSLDPYHAPDYRMQALASTVCLFLVRDPRDVAVSLAHFLHAPPQQFHDNKNLPPLYSSWHPYFSTMPDQYERLLRVIEGGDGWPDLKHFLAPFEPWSSQPNTVMLRYEDLVGEAGGGTTERQQMAVWQFQLACHFPGTTASLCQKLYDTGSATYRAGRIGSHLEEFQQAHIDAYRKLAPSPFTADGYGRKATLLKPFRLALPSYAFAMRLTNAVRTRLALDVAGDVVCDIDGDIAVICQMAGDSSKRIEVASPSPIQAAHNSLPKAVEQITTFLEENGFLLYSQTKTARQETIVLSAPTAAVQYARPTPISRNDEYNIIGYGNAYLAIAASLGDIDITALGTGYFRKLIGSRLIVQADSLNTLLSELRIDLPVAHPEREAPKQLEVPKVIESDTFGFNLVSYNEKILAVALRAGDIDLRDLGVRQKLTRDSLLFSFSSLSEAREILRLRHQVDRLTAVMNHLVAATTDTLPPHANAPKLLIENYKGFNLVALGQEVFAVSTAAGPTNLTDQAERTALQASKRLFTAPNLSAAFSAVDRATTKL